MSEIKDRIIEALRFNRMSAKELSDKTGIPKSSISQYMSGYAKPKHDRIYLIAKVLNVDEAWLIGYDVPMERKNNTSTSDSIQKITQYLKDKPDLLELYNELLANDQLTLLFDKTKDLTPQDVESVLLFVQTIRKQRGMEE